MLSPVAQGEGSRRESWLFFMRFLHFPGFYLCKTPEVSKNAAERGRRKARPPKLERVP